ncbi:Uncharacterised protein [Shigella flexneri]|nr:Uncharacterised protein [Shigella flexneri]SRO88930.1 Uncharacterised protein [Shigella flexneri]SRP99557.1 Uncharacterised protein [Shigella flexneri]SVH42550.1 Uncharacterised protein [Shigella flexneri]
MERLITHEAINTFDLILNLCITRQKTSDTGLRQRCSVD